MINRMTINGHRVPVGEMVLSFRYFGDETPPYASIDVLQEIHNDA